MSEPETDVREVPLDEAMTMAVAFQRRGQLDAAAEVYQKVLAVVPTHPDALHFLGVLCHQSPIVTAAHSCLACRQGRIDFVFHFDPNTWDF